jgi:hypothetical protein
MYHAITSPRKALHERRSEFTTLLCAVMNSYIILSLFSPLITVLTLYHQCVFTTRVHTACYDTTVTVTTTTAIT